MTEIPVSGSVLKWARDLRGLSRKDAAELLGIAVTDLEHYEEEKRKPTKTLFERFATRYELPQATLFLLTPPETPKPPADFRSVGGKRAASHSFDFHVALSNIRTWLFYYKRLTEQDEDFVAPKLPRLTLQQDPEGAGERLRRESGVRPDEQLGWKATRAFSNWRRMLEGQGILVFQQRFPLNDCRGYSIFDDADAPCIIVNREEDSVGARAFTLAHELGHLLLRHPGVSDQNFSNEVEAYCNRFAAAFLMPAEALRMLLPYWPNEPVDWDVKIVARCASRLKVSQRACALRLEQLGLAPAGYNQKFNWSRFKPKRKRDGGDYVATRLSDLGSAFVGQTLSALDRNVIDGVAAIEALGLSDEHLGRARHYVEKKSEVGVAT